VEVTENTQENQKISKKRGATIKKWQLLITNLMRHKAEKIRWIGLCLLLETLTSLNYNYEVFSGQYLTWLSDITDLLKVSFQNWKCATNSLFPRESNQIRFVGCRVCEHSASFYPVDPSGVISSENSLLIKFLKLCLLSLKLLPLKFLTKYFFLI
jgi:hypothetical protein